VIHEYGRDHWQQDEEFSRAWRGVIGLAAAAMDRFQIPRSDPDAWQVARIALWHAIRRHDPSRGKLTTYYYRVLLSHLSEHLSTVRFGISYPASLARASRLHRDRMLSGMPECLSLDHPLDSLQQPVPLADTVADNPIERVERRVALEQTLELIRCLLTPRQYEILVLRLGLPDGDEMTIREIAGRLGISVYSVNALLCRAVATIRQACRRDPGLQAALLSLTS
jgi:RNA polymerase sigma factor (sigma-70 family)